MSLHGRTETKLGALLRTARSGCAKVIEGLTIHAVERIEEALDIVRQMQ
jgi:hypothetical protein